MVKGLEIFRQYFAEYRDQYVLIGGTACDILFDNAGLPFRATKDLDMVLIVEAMTSQFGRRFWQFIRDGQYQNRQKSDGTEQYYRFDRPQAEGFPSMIELFSRNEALEDVDDAQKCVSIPIGEDISSLSAILLNADYYQLLLAGKEVYEDIVVLSPLHLILFKAKAWLDMTRRKTEGHAIDERDIRKHKNDIVRLAALLTGTESRILSAAVVADISAFLDHLQREPVRPSDVGIRGISFEEIIAVLTNAFAQYER